MEEMEKPRVLIVDDTKENIETLFALLKDDYMVVAAMNGESAIKKARKNKPDLILLDIIMPGMNGYEVCRQLKSDKSTAEIPIIFITAKNEVEDETKGLESGAVDYIIKPISPPIVKARVRNHLKLRNTMQDLKKSRQTVLNQSNERNELIHILCHDLLNPIGNAIAILDLIFTNKVLLEDFKEPIEVSLLNAQEIIDFVRKMKALEEHKLELELEPVNLEIAFKEAIVILQSMAKQKQVTISIDTPSDLTVLVERTSFLNSVLNNILSNAIKFSFPESNIEISTTQQDNEVRIIIRDHGIGIPVEIVRDIFDTGKPTSRSGTSGEQGTGYGMPLVKKFMTTYGGTIEVSSIEKTEPSTDHGTVVTLKLKRC